MKKVLLVSALAFCVSSAFAAEPTALLKVKGVLTNAACTPELSNGGVVDYGFIRLGELSNQATNQLGHKDVTLTINCTAPTKVGFTSTDDRASTKVPGLLVEKATYAGETYGSGGSTAYTFGVGETTQGVKIGAYSVFLNLDKLTADGKSVDGIYTQFAGTSWSSASVRSTLQEKNVRTFTVAETGTLEPLAFTTASFPMTTSLAIQDTNTLGITDDTPLDGQLTLTLRYL